MSGIHVNVCDKHKVGWSDEARCSICHPNHPNFPPREQKELSTEMQNELGLALARNHEFIVKVMASFENRLMEHLSYISGIEPKTYNKMDGLATQLRTMEIEAQGQYDVFLAQFTELSRQIAALTRKPPRKHKRKR